MADPGQEPEAARLAREAIARSRAATEPAEALDWTERAHRLLPGDPNIALGCAAAWLQREGHHVTFIDPLGPAEATSFGNAGSLSPSACLPVGMQIGRAHV